MAGALDSAHDVGLTHRDIKPQNILIGANDHAYLADFGLTQAGDEASLTETGQFIGTIDYVAPEQIQGGAATARSDVYSLTGGPLRGAHRRRALREAERGRGAVRAHLGAPAARDGAQSDLPPGLDDVIARGMAKLPADRYARRAS